MNYYLSVLKNYAVFSGRARRSEYWFFALFNFVIAIVLGALDGILNLNIGKNTGVLGAIYSLAVFIPSIAVMVRRLHDTNRSGWWILIGLVPFLGALVLIVLAVLDSTPGANKYGPNPKDVQANTASTASASSVASEATVAPAQSSASVTDTVATEAQVSEAQVPEVQPEAVEPPTDQLRA